MENENIFGCFVSSMMGEENGPIFLDYIWSDNVHYRIDPMFRIE